MGPGNRLVVILTGKRKMIIQDEASAYLQMVLLLQSLLLPMMVMDLVVVM